MDTTLISQVKDIIIQISNIATAVVVVITGIASFFAGHRRGTSSAIKRMNNDK